MTDAEWNGCTDPTALLDFLRQRRNQPTDRKLRLFAVAWCRRIWHLLIPQFQEAIEIGERYADGLAADEQRRLAHERLNLISVRLIEIEEEDCGLFWTGESVEESSVAQREREQYRRLLESKGIPIFVGATSGLAMAGATSGGNPFENYSYSPSGYEYAAHAVSQFEARNRDGVNESETAELARQCALLRDIFRGPFSTLVWKPTWRTSTVLNLAETIYQDRSFDHLPILADALEDAGCTNAEILNHCRQPGEHVRGCWVIDLLTGRS